MDTNSELTIDLDNLREEFCRAAANVDWSHTLAAQAEADVQETKDELERVRCRLSGFHRALLKGQDVKPTEQILEEQIVKSTDYIVAQRNYVEAIKRKGVQKGTALAYLKKADMLVSLGALVRAEMNLLPTIRNQ